VDTPLFLRYIWVMINFRKSEIYKNPNFILGLILFVFFLKGVLLSSAFPIFGGQDESRHYNTIQFLAEPKEKNWKMEKRTDVQQDKDDISTYRYSDEIKQTSLATNTDVLRSEIFNTIAFSSNDIGINESEIKSKPWQPINRITPPDMVYTSQFFHKITALIEKTFSNQDILIRFYLIRIFSVLLGTFAIFLSYLIAKNMGFSPKHSLMLAAIISFQPKFSMYFANINYDVLMIPMFFLFTLAGVLTLKKGLHWKNILLFVFSIAIATLTKGTGYMLIIILLALVAYLIYEKVKLQKKQIRLAVFGLSIFVFLFASLFVYRHFFSISNSFGETISSMGEYVSKTITFGKFLLPSSTYWGNLNWVNSWTLNNATNFIFIIEIAAIVGLGMMLFSKKIKTDFLPEKKYVIFLVSMIVFLQLGIRLVDWNIFNQIGGLKMSTGTPGRYFLPNLAAHIILVFTGLGALLELISRKYKLSVSEEKMLDHSLVISLILMFFFCSYLMFNVIIYRFYL